MVAKPPEGIPMNYLAIFIAGIISVCTAFWAGDTYYVTPKVTTTSSVAATNATTSVLASAGITRGTSVPAMIAKAVGKVSSETNAKIATNSAAIAGLEDANGQLAERVTKLETKGDPRATLRRNAKKFLDKHVGPGHAAILLDMHGTALGRYLNGLGTRLEVCAHNPAASYEDLRKEFLEDVTSAGYDGDDTMHRAARALVVRLDAMHHKVHVDFAPTEEEATHAGARGTLARLEVEAKQFAGLEAAIEFEKYRTSIDATEREVTTSGTLPTHLEGGGSD